MRKFIKPKGHEHHKVSTGICERLTFGYGKLDEYGYWEFPCRICVEANENQFSEHGECWPPS